MDITVYASFDIEDVPSGYNGSTGNTRKAMAAGIEPTPCVLTLGNPFPLQNDEEDPEYRFVLATIVIPFEELYIDFDNGIDYRLEDILPQTSLDTMAKAIAADTPLRYSDIASLELFEQEGYGWYGSYIKSLDVALSIEWEVKTTFVY